MRNPVSIGRLFARFSLRYMRRHPGRALGVLAGVALGAAVFTSVRIAVHASLASFSQSMDRIGGSAGYAIVHPGGRVDDRLVAMLLQRPEVEQAAPFLSTYVQSRAAGNGPFLLIGIAPLLDRGLRSWQAAAPDSSGDPAWADLLAEPGTLLIGGGLQRETGWREGSRVSLSQAQHRGAFKVLGVLRDQGLALVEGGRVAVTDIATYQEFTGLFGLVDRIDLTLKAATRPRAAAAADALRAFLPPDVDLVPAAAGREAGRDMIRAYQFNLSFLSFVSLFVGMFLVYSLVALNSAARRHEVAVLRSLGASARLIFTLFMAEGAFLGLIGWLAAMPLGALLTRWLLQGVSRTIDTLFVRVTIDRLHLSAWEIALSFAVTVGVAVTAAWQPAREAMRVAPREALSLAPEQRPGRLGAGRLAVLGLALIAAVYPISRLPSPAGISLPGYAAALLLFGGFALLSPYALKACGRWLAPLLLRRGDRSAWLAARHLVEGSARSTVSVGALITAVALFSALVIMIHSFRGTVALWVQQSFAGDLYLRPPDAELNRYRDPLDARVIAALKALPPPVFLVPLRRFELRRDRTAFTYEAIDIDAFTRRNTLIFMGGDPRRITADLSAGRGVVVSEVFANQTGLRTGDAFRTRLGASEISRPILGVFRDYRTRGGVVIDLLSWYREHLGDDSWSAAQVDFSTRGPGLAKLKNDIRSQLLASCGDAVEVTDGADLRGAVMRIFDQTFAVTTILLLISLVVAGLGIATTMAVLVLQRSRQLNTILAIGGSRGQLRRMILWESAMVVLAGQTAGLACGFILSHLLIQVVNRQSFGWTFLYRVDWPALGMAMPLIFAAALIATAPAVRLALALPPAALLRER